MKSRTARDLMYTCFGSAVLGGISSTFLIDYTFPGAVFLAFASLSSAGAGFYFRSIKDREEIKERNYALSHSLEDITRDIQYTPVGRGKRLKAKLR